MLIQGKRNPRAPDPPVDNGKNPHFLVLISENFIEARVALGLSGMTNISTQSPVKVDAASVSGPPSTSVQSGFFLLGNTICRASIIFHRSKFLTWMKR